jgi:hypothetical protein
MLYMLQIFLIVSIPIFVLAGTVLLSMIMWTELNLRLRSRLAAHRRRTATFTPAINTLAFHKPR